MPVLSTGQEYNPVAKDWLKENVSPGALLSATGRNARFGALMGGASILDSFVSERMGDWMRDRAFGEPQEKNLSAKDIMTIMKTEFMSFFKKQQQQQPPAEEIIPPKPQSKPADKPVVLPTQSDPKLLERISSIDDTLHITADDIYSSNKHLQDMSDALYIISDDIRELTPGGQTLSLKETNKHLDAISDAVYIMADDVNKVEKNTSGLFEFFKKKETSSAVDFTVPNHTSPTLSTDSVAPAKGDGFDLTKLLGKIPGLDALAKLGKAGGLAGAAGSLAKVVSPGSLAKGVGVGALGAVAVDSFTDAINSFKTGESNKYARGADTVLEKVGVLNKGETLGSKTYDVADKAAGSWIGNMLGFKSDAQKQQDAEKAAMKPYYDKFKSGQPVSAFAASQIKKLYGEEVPKTLITNGNVALDKNSKSSPQAVLSDQVAKSEKPVNNSATAAAPQVIQVPVATPGAAPQPVMNFNSTNNDSTFRRLNERLYASGAL